MKDRQRSRLHFQNIETEIEGGLTQIATLLRKLNHSPHPPPRPHNIIRQRQSFAFADLPQRGEEKASLNPSHSQNGQAEEEEILLEGYSSSRAINEEKQADRGKRADSLVEVRGRYSEEYVRLFAFPIHAAGVAFDVETRHNWVERFLDWKDCQIEGRFKDRPIIILEEENGAFCYCQSGAERSTSKEYRKNSLMKMIDQQFYKDNATVTVRFNQHLRVWKLLPGEGQSDSFYYSRVYELTIAESSRSSTNKIRLILEAEMNSGSLQSMQRIVLLKQARPNARMEAQETPGYEVVWGNYDKQSFREPLLLEVGHKYVILQLKPSRIATSVSSINIYFKQQDEHMLTLRADSSNGISKMMCVLEKAFCQHLPTVPAPPASLMEEESMLLEDAVTLEQQTKVSDGEIDANSIEFLRVCFMDLGLLIEVYRNIYSSAVKFINPASKDESKRQDKKLIFSELQSISRRQEGSLVEEELEPGEKVVKFYSIEEKPARLFVPERKIIKEGRAVDCLKSHTIFK